MTTMKVTVRVEITDSNGRDTTVERTVEPRGFGDNPVFFANVAEQASLAARVDVCQMLEAVHGVAPRPASVTIS